MPKERLEFKTRTPDGKIAIVYKAGYNSRLSVSNVILGSAIPPAILAPYLVPPELLFYSYTALFLPSMYALFDRFKTKKRNVYDIDEMHVFENGEQLLVKTADGILHKLSIIDNETHRYDVGRDKSLVFTMENSGREYKMRTKDAEVLDY